MKKREHCTCLTNSQKIWRFSDNLLGDPAFIEGLYNTIRDALNQLFTTRDTPLHLVQTVIVLQRHASSNIFSVAVRKIRDYCMAEQRKRVQTMRDKENEMIEGLI